MARAVMAESFGSPENYELRTLAQRKLGPGELRVSVRAAGISYVDVLTAEGKYQVKPPLPFCPGSEAAGIVTEIGNEIRRVSLGDRVAISGWGGMYAEEAVMPEAAAHAIPPGMDLAEAATFPVSYATAWHALVDRGRLQSGETLLVLGAGGATGYAAVQIGKHLGARVIASASSEAKRSLTLSGGADAAIDARADDWREQVKSANHGRGVDVVFDPVGGDATERAFRSLDWKGRHLIVGFPGGIASLRTNLPLLKGSSLVGVDIRQFGEFEPERAAENRRKIFSLAAEGVLRPAIARRFPLEQFREAMRIAAVGSSAGRIVLTMD